MTVIQHERDSKNTEMFYSPTEFIEIRLIVFTNKSKRKQVVLNEKLNINFFVDYLGRCVS